MALNPLREAAFTTAAHRLDQLPADVGCEIAFAGRSNAGKSSALNALVGTGGLARTSKTPGRTQQLVVFTLPDGRRLIDLPGYGYAKVPADLREHWRGELERYLRERRSLRGLALIMDIRHPLKDFDRAMLAFCADTVLPCHVLLSKADKLGRGEMSRTLAQVRRELAGLGAGFSAQALSALRGEGVDEARAALAVLMEGPARD
ncbi:MAG: YihA family ribosome biogenesis GTP-binding protein [Xanthomonadaceae bacterium]|nr:YihA family ribosome biogenesis GTP-binding protein [Xanthomonadaceae bacterium]MDE1958525.1 YihA family ribosome biogenesis GTP-binding protein [Xanthomonadaceae bacterium]MDE2178725.1 YihA family ribosome biogenesis GTP-binding protein [Xanthomonadaceae bacterium]MDE2246822.1 YihA family ribosome biogenesis GTP-binding protein [Xanthomonadaceae bacterium]